MTMPDLSDGSKGALAYRWFMMIAGGFLTVLCSIILSLIFALTTKISTLSDDVIIIKQDIPNIKETVKSGREDMVRQVDILRKDLKESDGAILLNKDHIQSLEFEVRALKQNQTRTP
jgi:hypothetical protein